MYRRTPVKPNLYEMKFFLSSAADWNKTGGHKRRNLEIDREEGSEALIHTEKITSRQTVSPREGGNERYAYTDIKMV